MDIALRKYVTWDTAPSRHAVLTGGRDLVRPLYFAPSPWNDLKITGIRPLYTAEEATLNYWREGYDAIGFAAVLLPAGPGETALFAAGGFTGTILRPGQIPINQARPVRNWGVGDPINNLTAFRTVPAWSTVRQRYWKNEAFFHATNYSPANLARMRLGLAPQRINDQTGRIESMELHHDPPQRAGGLFRVERFWPGQHQLVDPLRRIGR